MSLSSIIIFLVMLLVLVLVHEFGHFIAAKLLKIRVDEFAFGFPPKLFSKKIGETEYIFNALPLGGYVKIHGEDGTEENKKDPRSFASKKWWQQVIVLIAGVTMNVLFAYLVFIGLSLGNKIVDSSDPLFERAFNKQLIIVDVTKGSPADLAGILPGSEIVSVIGKTGSLTKLTAEDMIAFVGKNQEGVSMRYKDTEGTLDIVTLAPVFWQHAGQRIVDICQSPYFGRQYLQQSPESFGILDAGDAQRQGTGCSPRPSEHLLQAAPSE